MKLKVPKVFVTEVPVLEECNIEVVKAADVALCAFKMAYEVEWEKASSLYEGAKNAFEEVEYHWTQGKKKVHHGEWTADDFDKDLMNLFQRQEPVWNGLDKGVEDIRKKMDFLYQKVEETVMFCKLERGEGCHVAWAHIPTPEQAEIRRQYNLRLKPDLDDAKSQMDLLNGYPSGILTQVNLLHKDAMSKTADLVAQLKKQEEHHRGFGHIFRREPAVTPS